MVATTVHATTDSLKEDAWLAICVMYTGHIVDFTKYISSRRWPVQRLRSTLITSFLVKGRSFSQTNRLQVISGQVNSWSLLNECFIRMEQQGLGAPTKKQKIDQAKR